MLAELLWRREQREGAFAELREATAALEDRPASYAKAYVLSELARYRMLAEEPDAQTAQEALEMAKALELGEVQAHVLITTGTARALTGDPQGKADLQRGLNIALAGNYVVAANRGYMNLSNIAQIVDGDLPEGLRLALEAEKVAQRYGAPGGLRWIRGILIGFWFELGNWDKSGPAADEFLAESAAVGPHYHDAYIRCCRSWMRLARGDVQSALEDQRESLVCGRQVKDPQVLFPVLAVSAYVLAAAGRPGQARRLLSELSGAGTAEPLNLYEGFTDCVLAALILGRRDQARQWLGARRDSPWLVAARALVDQQFVTAAESLDSMGAARSAALARLHAAQEFIKAGQPTEAEDQLRYAFQFFRPVGATHFIRQGQALLAASA